MSDNKKPDKDFTAEVDAALAAADALIKVTVDARLDGIHLFDPVHYREESVKKDWTSCSFWKSRQGMYVNIFS